MNLIVSLSAGLLSWGFADRIEAANSFLYGTFVFFGTFSVYNLQRVVKIAQANMFTPWLLWVKRNRAIIITLSVISGVGALTSLWLLHLNNIISITVLSFAVACSLLYVVRINGINLRGIPFLKIHVISITWTLLVVIFPKVSGGSIQGVIYVFLAHYFYILSVTIPFDIRDLKYDNTIYKTIPQILGVNRAKWLAVLFLMFYTALIQLVFPLLLFSPWFWLGVFFTGCLIIAVNERVSDWYCAGLIDGSIGLLGLVYLLT